MKRIFEAFKSHVVVLLSATLLSQSGLASPCHDERMRNHLSELSGAFAKAIGAVMLEQSCSVHLSNFNAPRHHTQWLNKVTALRTESGQEIKFQCFSNVNNLEFTRTCDMEIDLNIPDLVLKELLQTTARKFAQALNLNEASSHYWSDKSPIMNQIFGSPR